MDFDENGYRYITVDGKDYQYRTNIKTILFLGIDTSNESKNQGQSDVIELILFDRDQQKIKILSLSRDTICNIHLFDSEVNDLGWDNQYLGLAYSYGKDKKYGCILTKNAISKLLKDIPLVNYTSFDISTLKDMQGVVGNMKIVLDDDYVDIDPSWEKGQELTITQDNVETFLRVRNTTQDFSNRTRMQRQKLYIETYINQLKMNLNNDYKSTLNKMYEFYNQLTTNVTLKEIDNYTDMILNYSIDEEDYYSLQEKIKKESFMMNLLLTKIN